MTKFSSRDEKFLPTKIFADEYFLQTKISKLYYSAIILAVDRKFYEFIVCEFIVCGIQLIQGNNEKRRNLFEKASCIIRRFTKEMFSSIILGYNFRR